ncbi:ATP-binding protein [Cylindrospermopsis raciborskii]|uniref:ATP-binding protein n=1 Tax=Cylindrospermopsis raciborskii TaxID=77022 RepID=UPI0038792A03
MLSDTDLSFAGILPLSIFNQLGDLLHQVAHEVDSAALILTEAVLVRISVPPGWQPQRFILVVSQQFSALLLGNLPDSAQQGQSISDTTLESLHIHFTFNSEAIANFATRLSELFAANSHIHQNILQCRELLGANNATYQSKFTILLLQYLLPTISQNTINPHSLPPEGFTCKPVEDALTKQIAQEKLLNQVTTQIRKSLDLPVIMSTAITQVREFLELDRLVIYKFVSAPINNPINNLHDLIPNNSLTSPQSQYFSPRSVDHQWFTQDSEHNGGCVIYESLGGESINSILNSQEDCLAVHSPCWQKYHQGFILVVEDVEKTYILENCLLNFLRTNQIRAKVVAPIIFENKLWGLLIAHQCHAPRQWTEPEKALLSSIAEQLAIAINQSQLMDSLREATRKLIQEKQTLEQRVIERTMALREALLAAEAASRIRNEFLATISHELLTPLTHVIGMSSTLLRWPLGELTPRQREYLQTIHDSGERLLEMINDILDLSQIQAGKTVLNICEFSLTRLAENIVDSLLEKSTNAKVTLKLDVQVNPRHDQFSADPGRIEQIIWNLLTNAIKFTPQGGNVTLRFWVEDNTVIFQVEDTGIGIPEEKLPLVFEKFQQVDASYHRPYEGTGIGLALTKQIVELHRGRIEVESTVGVGSIFTVWIPSSVFDK